VLTVRFPSPVESPDPENNIVHAELFEPTNPTPKGGAGVVVLHILGADFAHSRYLAARLADRGVTALFVKLPYYGERRPAHLGNGKRFLSADIERSTLAMRQGICDVRRAAAWLAARPGVDPERLGIAGVSLGGIVGSVAAAVDPSLKQAALLLAGGDRARILWEMPEPEAAKARQAWINSGRTRADLENLCRPFDPLTHGQRLQGKKVLMFAGRADEVIPPDCSKALWEVAGRPAIEWLDCGHYSAAGLLLPAFRRTVDFFAD
ncbi:MAG: alpha/beta hydrolase, partial [Isosphaeraceae bacterium]